MLERSKRQWKHNFGTEMSKKRQEYERRESEKAANRVDRGKLSEMWNDN